MVGRKTGLLKQKILALAQRQPMLKSLLFYYFCYLKKGVAPPQLFNFVGGEEFEAIGKHYFKLMQTHGGVQPEHKILQYPERNTIQIFFCLNVLNNLKTRLIGG